MVRFSDNKFKNAYFLMRFGLSSFHTKIPENADNNRDFSKRFQNPVESWKTRHRFENLPFLVWTGENGSFGKRWRNEKESYAVASISDFGLFSVDDTWKSIKTLKSMCFRLKRINVDRWKPKKPLVKAKIFSFVFVEKKMDTEKKHKWGRGLSRQTKAVLGLHLK